MFQDKILALQELLQASEQFNSGFERSLESTHRELQQYKAALAKERFDHHRTQSSSDEREAGHAKELAQLRSALAKEKAAHDRTRHHLDVCSQAMDIEHKVGSDNPAGPGHGSSLLAVMFAYWTVSVACFTDVFH